MLVPDFEHSSNIFHQNTVREKFYFDCLSEFRLIILSKFKNNLDRNSYLNSDEINLGGILAAVNHVWIEYHVAEYHKQLRENVC
jgi:hypothetical protein